jgi:hypothetical protein
MGEEPERGELGPNDSNTAATAAAAAEREEAFRAMRATTGFGKRGDIAAEGFAEAARGGVAAAARLKSFACTSDPSPESLP